MFSCTQCISLLDEYCTTIFTVLDWHWFYIILLLDSSRFAVLTLHRRQMVRSFRFMIFRCRVDCWWFEAFLMLRGQPCGVVCHERWRVSPCALKTRLCGMWQWIGSRMTTNKSNEMTLDSFFDCGIRGWFRCSRDWVQPHRRVDACKLVLTVNNCLLFGVVSSCLS